VTCPLLAGWYRGFIADTKLDATQKSAEDAVANSISQQRLYVWRTDKPVSMAQTAGPTPNGIRISLVYTPPEYRGRGYASANVAALSQRMLDQGRKFCFLFTDLANPTSNKIYQHIGYVHQSNVAEYRFGA
jgi:uncharacterized protein